MEEVNLLKAIGTMYLNNREKYEGDWKNNEMTGRGNWIYSIGIYTFRGGCRYEGEHSKGVKNGKGIFYFENGDKYNGEYKDNKRNGQGDS